MPPVILDIDIMSEWVEEGSVVARDLSDDGTSEIFSGISSDGEYVGYFVVGMGVISAGAVVGTIVSIVSSVEI